MDGATDTPTIIPLGEAWIYIYSGYTITRFRDGTFVTARHDDVRGLGQVRRARRLGYPSAEALNASHDLCHSLLASWLGEPYSPTLYAQAHGTVDPWWYIEEMAVLAVQRLTVTRGIDLIARAQYWSTHDGPEQHRPAVP